MKPVFLELLRCPKTNQRLALAEPCHYTNDEIDSGWLVSADGRQRYPIRKSIPRFIPGSNYAESFGYQWNIHGKTQLDSHTGMSISRRRLFQSTDWPEDLNGQRILEAGSGAGRFTEVLVSTGAEVFSFDYSSAVDANYLNNNHNRNFHIFQGDIFNIPLCKSHFDKVICLGVLQHTPDPERAFQSLTSYVRPGGQIVVDVYTKSWISLLQWKYLLRPISKQIDNQRLYQSISKAVPKLLPITIYLKKIAGRLGARLSPIVEYSHLGLSADLNRHWAILDTFDMYSPQHDHPQSMATVRRWFENAGFDEIHIAYGSNGIVGRGRRPENH